MPPTNVHPAEFHVLLALADGSKHGHGIKLDVRARTDGAVEMGPGTLYGAIKRLVTRGWIAESGRDPRRRFYALTSEGDAAVRAEVRRLRGLLGIAEAKQLVADADR